MKGRDLLLSLVKRNPSRLHRNELAHAHNAIAGYRENFYMPNDKQEANANAQGTEQAWVSAVDLWQQLAKEEPESSARLKDLAGGYTNLAFLYAGRGELDKAKDLLDKALRFAGN